VGQEVSGPRLSRGLAHRRYPRTVPVSSEQFQTTPLTPSPAAPEGTGEQAKKLAPDPDRIGVVLVHGIGTQAAAETFLDWTRPLVDLLADWRRDHDCDIDPVRRSQFSFNGASLPYLEIDIPAYGALGAQTWIFTEAWWAAQLRPPKLGTVVAYLRHGLGRILQGIRAGYDVREKAYAARLEQELAARRTSEEEKIGVLEGTTELQLRQASIIQETLAGARRWRWIRALDAIQRWLTIIALGPAFVLGTALLLVYAPLRAIPFKPLRDLAVLRQADNYLVQWAGDLPTLLQDPVQSANVRARTVEAIDGLVAQGCGRIVIVAHSGGAIVSYTTLLDQAYTTHTRSVAKLITLGQGLGLAWHLEDRTRLLDRGNRLAGDLVTDHPDLIWYDFWASYDPAPGGPLEHPRGLKLPVDSRPVTNRMSIFEDHGSYWDNDEGFVIPLIRHLDTAAGRPDDPPGSRFFPDGGHRVALIERRRQRVGVLALWRWLAVLGALLPIVLGTVLGPAGAGLGGLGRSATEFWGTVPAHEIVSAPLDWLAGLAQGPGWLYGAGEWLLGAGLVALLFLIVGLVGLRWWADWDLHERRIAHSSILLPVDRRRAAATFLALVVLAGLISATVTWALLR
jgi:hypothetical protein